MITKDIFTLFEAKDDAAIKAALIEAFQEQVASYTEIVKEIVIDESFGEPEVEQLNEAAPRIIIRVNARGQRTKKKICPKGYKLVDGTKCVAISASQRTNKKIAIRKALRTKRADVNGKRKAIRKQKKAMIKRRQQGL